MYRCTKIRDDQRERYRIKVTVLLTGQIEYNNNSETRIIKPEVLIKLKQTVNQRGVTCVFNNSS